MSYTAHLGCGWDLVCGEDAKGAHKVHNGNDALLGGCGWPLRVVKWYSMICFHNIPGGQL